MSGLPTGARLVAVIDGGQAFLLSGRLVLQAQGCEADLCTDLECLAQFQALFEAAADALAAEQDRAARMAQPKIPAGARCTTCGDLLTQTVGAGRWRGKWYCTPCLARGR